MRNKPKTKREQMLGLDRFPQDLFRHTFGSYALALHRDAGRVATSMGNSAAVLLSRYHEPVNPAACVEFWRVGMTKNDLGGLVAAAGRSQPLNHGKANGPCESQAAA